MKTALIYSLAVALLVISCACLKPPEMSCKTEISIPGTTAFLSLRFHPDDRFIRVQVASSQPLPEALRIIIRLRVRQFPRYGRATTAEFPVSLDLEAGQTEAEVLSGDVQGECLTYIFMEANVSLSREVSRDNAVGYALYKNVHDE